jgi:hypothetical protein
MTHGKIALATSLGLSLALMSTALRADDADDAKDLYSKGVALFEQLKFQEASVAFRKAYELRPTWKIQYNIGQCEASAKRYGLAVEAFEAYLVGGGDEVPVDRRDYVVEEIRRLQTLVGRLDVAAPEGVEVVVDGEVRAKTPLTGPVRVAVGNHEVALKRGDETLLTKTVNIAGDMTTTVRLSDESPEGAETAPPEPETGPGPEPAPQAEPAPTPETSAGKPLVTAGWAGIGTGLAVVVAGAVTGALALGKSNDLEDRCPDKQSCPASNRDLKTSADTLSLTTNVLLPLGGVVAATGLVLVILGKKQQKTERALSLRPGGGPGGGGVLVEGRF